MIEQGIREDSHNRKGSRIVSVGLAAAIFTLIGILVAPHLPFSVEKSSPVNLPLVSQAGAYPVVERDGEYESPFVAVVEQVAVDAVGLKLIMAKRTEQLGKDKAVPPVPRHIRDAEVKYGLGNSDLNKIDLVKLGWTDDILI